MPNFSPWRKKKLKCILANFGGGVNLGYVWAIQGVNLGEVGGGHLGSVHPLGHVQWLTNANGAFFGETLRLRMLKNR